MIEKYIAQINPHEMACRIAEAAIAVKRPEGVSAEAALKQLDPEAIAGFYRAAWAAAKYLEESINDCQRVQ